MSTVIEMTSDQVRIKELCESRGVQYLLHFTRERNLDSILRRGLISRDVLSEEGVFLFNDEIRLDGTSAVCLSVSFPNYKLFYRFRQVYSGERWVVLAFNPSILWSQSAIFCSSNAASSAVTSIPFQDRKGFSAFEGMFLDCGGVGRSVLGIPDNCPTNPQAEILVSHVDIDNLIGVIVPDILAKVRLSSEYDGIEFVAFPGFFNPRVDYRHWSSGG